MKKALLVITILILTYLSAGFGSQKLGTYYFEKRDLEKSKRFYSIASNILFFSDTPDYRISIVERDEDNIEKLLSGNYEENSEYMEEPSEEPPAVETINQTEKDKDAYVPPAPVEDSFEEINDFQVFSNEPEIDAKHPIIIKVSDSKGNYTTGSSGNGIPFFVTWPEPKPKVKSGEAIKITVEAKDPNSKELKYKFKDNRNKTLKDWSSSNTFDWKVDKDQGGNPFIVPMIKNRDDVLRYGDSDDSTVLYYELK